MLTDVVGTFIAVKVVPEIIPNHEKSRIYVYRDNNNIPRQWKQNAMILSHDKTVLTTQVVGL